MLIEIKVSNFLSFKDEQKFSMVALNKYTELKDNLINIEDNFSVLKTASLFGANGSGKSNLFEAIRFIRRAVLSSFRDSDKKLLDSHFKLNPKYKELDSFFEIVFFSNDKLVRYSFGMGRERMNSEQLFIDEELIFNVLQGKLIYINESFLDETETMMKWKIKNNKTLFLSILSKTNTEFIDFIIEYFRCDLNVIQCLGSRSANYTKNLVNNKSELTPLVLKLLKEADVNIIDLDTKEREVDFKNLIEKDVPEEILTRLKLNKMQLLTKHNIYDDSGNVIDNIMFDSESNESSGTNEILRIAGPIADTLENGRVLILDEMDAQLHPLMANYVISLFHSSINKNNAQLIISSHNPEILSNDILRRDQIWFVEKDVTEASHLTSLINYRDKGEVIRKDVNFRKNYLQGKFGAIPLLKPSNIMDEGEI
ncbi:AAA family ATPase [Listeria monocytogenes]|nr:AAA family ATPase [Listeria monocytogenes]ELK8001496.1 AAA family ATPase [Listeria monocytogenes]ELK8009700.1 AAA family ATPase [Listeria monocytogenes]ELK8012580.1 AAA family ATPase [Listeria monocytogenes]ELK8015442.1 AAA family ATPase [Listeria monocytogenes]